MAIIRVCITPNSNELKLARLIFIAKHITRHKILFSIALCIQVLAGNGLSTLVRNVRGLKIIKSTDYARVCVNVHVSFIKVSFALIDLRGQGEFYQFCASHYFSCFLFFSVCSIHSFLSFHFQFQCVNIRSNHWCLAN